MAKRDSESILTKGRNERRRGRREKLSLSQKNHCQIITAEAVIKLNNTYVFLVFFLIT